MDLLNLYTQDTLECLAVSAGWRQNYAEPNFKSIYIPTSSQSCHTFTSKQTEAKDFFNRSWQPHVFSAAKQTVMNNKRNFLVFVGLPGNLFLPISLH